MPGRKKEHRSETNNRYTIRMAPQTFYWMMSALPPQPQPAHTYEILYLFSRKLVKLVLLSETFHFFLFSESCTCTALIRQLTRLRPETSAI